MKKFDNLDDCAEELKIIDDELSAAYEDEDMDLCLEKVSVRSIIVSQINQLRRTQKLSKKSHEKLKKSWENGNLLFENISKKQSNIKTRLDKHKKFNGKVKKYNYGT